MGIYEDVTNRIVAAIEGGVDGTGWKMPWHGSGGRAVNVSSSRAYRGVNTLSLWCEARARGYGSDTWGTFKQWQAADARVQRGAKGSVVVFWRDLPRSDDDEDKRFVMRSSYVFNADQVDGYAPVIRPRGEGFDKVAEAEAFVESIHSLDLRFGGGRAYYNPPPDFVQMPARSDFHHAEGYYSTLLHECAHWSGHPARLAREFGKRFGSETYAFEEPVAELAAAFLCGDLGLENEPRPDHAEYIAGWLKVLKSDPRAIFKASSEAAKAADYLSAFSQKELSECA